MIEYQESIRKHIYMTLAIKIINNFYRKKDLEYYYGGGIQESRQKRQRISHPDED